MAPADMSTLASTGSTSSNGSTFSSNPVKAVSNGRSPLPLHSVASKPRPNSTTVLSPPSKISCISDGHAESYDEVRRTLCTQPSWSDQNQKVIMEPYEHLASRPGKEIRSQMIDAFNIWLKVPDEKIKVIHKVIGMLHTSSLLVDDVEDNSILRRGAPVAHLIYGIPQTINTANYVYFLVFGEIINMTKDEDSQQQMKIQEMIIEEMINLHRGQGMDLYWRDNLVCPTESEYVEMVNNKTSGLLRIVIKLMVASSPMGIQKSHDELKEMLIPLINMVGLLFQIRDDYMNLQSGDYAQNKGYCEDLTEGKFSFPLIHSIRASSSSSGQREFDATSKEKHIQNGKHVKSQSNEDFNEDVVISNRENLLSILQSRPKDAATKRKVVEYMEKQTASFEYSRNVMARLDRLVQSETISLEEKLGKGDSNLRLRGILAALRKGWC